MVDVTILVELKGCPAWIDRLKKEFYEHHYVSCPQTTDDGRLADLFIIYFKLKDYFLYYVVQRIIETSYST
jgi:hypothetical protein